MKERINQFLNDKNQMYYFTSLLLAVIFCVASVGFCINGVIYVEYRAKSEAAVKEYRDLKERALEAKEAAINEEYYNEASNTLNEPQNTGNEPQNTGNEPQSTGNESQNSGDKPHITVDESQNICDETVGEDAETLPDAGNSEYTSPSSDKEETLETEVPYLTYAMLDEYIDVYFKNMDIVGWLTVDGTKIDYPVMQTPLVEEYYIHMDANKRYNINGSLFASANVQVGTGYCSNNYLGGVKPSTNIIIFGHNMASGAMFGTLKYFLNEKFALEHRYINFDTLYEHRKYEIVSVFKTTVLNADEEGFRYYSFFEAENEEDFYYFYENIKNLSIYDFETVAEYKDEFITLSTCSMHITNGRLVVIGKRVYD